MCPNLSFEATCAKSRAGASTPVGPHEMRFLILAALAFVSWRALALPDLLLSHVQHFYAGGGGCVKRFWLEWEGSAEITDMEILVELKSERDEIALQVLRLAGRNNHLGPHIVSRCGNAAMP